MSTQKSHLSKQKISPHRYDVENPHEYYCRECHSRITVCAHGSDSEYGHKRECQHSVRKYIGQTELEPPESLDIDYVVYSPGTNGKWHLQRDGENVCQQNINNPSTMLAYDGWQERLCKDCFKLFHEVRFDK